MNLGLYNEKLMNVNSVFSFPKEAILDLAINLGLVLKRVKENIFHN